MEEQEVIQEEEQVTTTTQQQNYTTTTMSGQTVVFNLSNSDDYSSEPLTENRENIIHQLFYELGCDLDYTPTNVNQRFTMTLQFIAGLWFIWWLVKLMYTLMKQFFNVGR